jgi:hypothetical protein
MKTYTKKQNLLALLTIIRIQDRLKEKLARLEHGKSFNAQRCTAIESAITILENCQRKKRIEMGLEATNYHTIDELSASIR